VDSKFIDVDFPSDPNFVFGDCGMGAFRAGTFAAYSDEAPVYPETDWKEMAANVGFGCANLITRTYNQKQEGSCVANAASQSNEITQALQFGPENVVHLSAMSLYKRIGRSASSGAMVSDGLEEMSERGILPLTDEANKARFKHTMENTGWKQQLPQGWEETGKMFKVQEWLVCDHVNELISRLLDGKPVVVGRSGHSICYVAVVFRDGQLFVLYVNSWGEWGETILGRKAFGYDSMAKIKSSANWSFAPVSVTVPTFQRKAA
jgi:hypothetical protein